MMKTKEETTRWRLAFFFVVFLATCECILCALCVVFLLCVGLIGAVHAQVNLGQDG